MPDGDLLWLPDSVMRQEATVQSTTVDALQYVQGYMVPRYIDRLPDGRRVAELYQNDIDRVADGYGCGECLAMFNRRFSECPSCGHRMDANADIVDFRPPYWDDYEGRTSAEILGGDEAA